MTAGRGGRVTDKAWQTECDAKFQELPQEGKDAIIEEVAAHNRGVRMRLEMAKLENKLEKQKSTQESPKSSRAIRPAGSIRAQLT